MGETKEKSTNKQIMQSMDTNVICNVQRNVTFWVKRYLFVVVVDNRGNYLWRTRTQ